MHIYQRYGTIIPNRMLPLSFNMRYNLLCSYDRVVQVYSFLTVTQFAFVLYS